MPLTVDEFVIRWKTYDQSEEAGAKPHFRFDPREWLPGRLQAISPFRSQ
jgi:hypothetical protein